MEPLFFELTKILKQQRDVAKEILASTQEQNTALRQNDLPGLNEAIKQLTKHTMQMAQLDPKREEVQVKLEKTLGLKPGATISQMLPHAPAAVQKELKELQQEIKEHFDQLQELNQFNKVLTNRALQVNTALLKILNPGSGPTYHSGGKVTKEENKLEMLNKTV
ncbi:flagellar protein FlgN [Desulfofalx alkaliphila]|uniref:flagellar protein FlgN n=1 Tax=Desulfofalx alkaliphila TaxID=105483 RepID=UPI0004E1D55C|nr:flagellar protein FlgN [Desulfofalx alkaliphila]